MIYLKSKKQKNNMIYNRIALTFVFSIITPSVSCSSTNFHEHDDSRFLTSEPTNKPYSYDNQKLFGTIIIASWAFLLISALLLCYNHQNECLKSKMAPF